MQTVLEGEHGGHSQQEAIAQDEGAEQKAHVDEGDRVKEKYAQKTAGKKRGLRQRRPPGPLSRQRSTKTF